MVPQLNLQINSVPCPSVNTVIPCTYLWCVLFIKYKFNQGQVSLFNITLYITKVKGSGIISLLRFT